MKTALLVGNGLTANLITEYSNEHMMNILKCNAPETYQKADNLFAPFRKTVSPARLTSVGFGYCGDDIFCGESPMAQPITGLPFNEELINHKKKVLGDIGFSSEVNSAYEEYFQTYGLIFETQNQRISSVESLLKIVSLFQKNGLFSDEDIKKITGLSNNIYFNNGKNRLADVDSKIHEPLKTWLNQYSYIYTTNYDCVIDDACEQRKDIMHMHGGFFYKDLYTKSEDVLLAPDEACLIWGISGENKESQMHGGITFPLTFPLIFPESLFDQYIGTLRTSDIYSIDVFGYSGENDQHINSAIISNPSIKIINYYCDPNVKNSEVLHFDLTNKFKIPSDKKLQLISWDEIWDKIK